MQKKILLINREDDFEENLGPKLKAKNYQIETASSCNEALNKFNSFNPHVVITSLMLEHFDSGFVLAHKMKKQNPHLVLLILTRATHITGIEFSLSTKEERAWIKADAFLNNPIPVDDLMDIMETALERKEKKVSFNA